MKANKIGTVFLVSTLALAGIGISFAGLTDSIHVYGTVKTGTVDLEIHNYSGTWVWKVWGIGAPDGEIHVYTGYEENKPDMAALETLYPGCNIELISWAKGRDAIASDPTNQDTGLAYDAIVEFYNLFPCIDFHADIVFHYNGTIPAKIINVDMGWEGEETLLPDDSTGDWLAYLYSTGDLTYKLGQSALPAQIHYCELLYYEANIHIPQNNLFQGLSGTGYLTIEVQQWNDECDGTTEDKVLNLPDPASYLADCTLTGTPGPTFGTYFDTALIGIPFDPDYNVWNGLWPGWCVDEGETAQNGFVELWDTYDPLMPYPDDDWDLVNYIINYYHVGDVLPEGSITWDKLQDAIWRFINGGYSGSDPVVTAIIDDAIANGEGFVPEEGQDCAILLWPVDANHDRRYGQVTLIIVDP